MTTPTEYVKSLDTEEQSRFLGRLEDMIEVARKQPDKAAFYADNFLPEIFNKDALYAAIAAGYEFRANERSEGHPEHKTNIDLAEYFKAKCSYFSGPTN